MLVIISETRICDNCKHEWDTTEYLHTDGFINCPKCDYENPIGVTIMASCCDQTINNTINVIKLEIE